MSETKIIDGAMIMKELTKLREQIDQIERKMDYAHASMDRVAAKLKYGGRDDFRSVRG